MKPIQVPIVVALCLKRFSARALIKIKPFWESNRVWFGFYRKPELVLELEVEPIISDKLIKLSMVNEVIQKRIKQLLEAYVMLPNMDDLSFWDFDQLNTSPFHPETINEKQIKISSLKPPVNIETERSIFSLDGEVLNPRVSSEPIESRYDPHSYNLRPSITNYISTLEKHIDSFVDPQITPIAINEMQINPTNSPISVDGTVTEGTVRSGIPDSLSDQTSSLYATKSQVGDETTSQASETASSIVEFIGNAAYNLGQISRQIASDQRTKNVISSVANLAKPAVSFARKQSRIVQTQAAIVGLSAIEKLGLKPDDESEDDFNPNSKIIMAESSSTGDFESGRRDLKHKSSGNSWSILGLNISTNAPQDINKQNHKSLANSDSTSSLSASSENSVTNVIFEKDEEFNSGELYLDKGGLRLRVQPTMSGEHTPISHSRKGSTQFKSNTHSDKGSIDDCSEI
jgi:hypothetical protein